MKNEWHMKQPIRPLYPIRPYPSLYNPSSHPSLLSTVRHVRYPLLSPIRPYLPSPMLHAAAIFYRRIA